MEVVNSKRSDAPKGATAFPYEQWTALAASGLFSAAIEDGRSKRDRVIGTMQALERMGETCPDSGFNFSVATHLASTITALDQCGSAYLKERYLPRLINGDLIGAHAISEPEAGSDALSMTTTARLDGDDYVLNGYKAFVTNGPIADVVVVYAKTSASATADSVSAFLVRTKTKGVLMGPELIKVGLTNSPICELRLTECRVPAHHMIGAKGAGFFVLTQVMQREILYSFVINIGEMKRRLGECVSYARSRRQFGQAIGAFQAVSNKIADMKIRYELGRSWLYQVAERLGAGKDVTSEIAIAKVFISESSISTAIDALHLHGGRGYIAENGFGSGVCDALAAAVYSGTNDIQRGRIAAMLGVGSKAKEKPLRTSALHDVTSGQGISGAEHWHGSSAIFDYLHPAVQRYVSDVIGHATHSEKDKAVKIYHAVRDDIFYEVFSTDISGSGLSASSIIKSRLGFCLHKAILFVAACRAAGLAARLLADKVKNHASSEELCALVGGQEFLHWFAEVKVNNVWLKASPTFNKKMCQLFGMRPLDFDGASHAIDQHYGGEVVMEYMGQQSVFADPGHEDLLALIQAHHPRMVTADRIVPKKSTMHGLSRQSICS